MRRFELVVVGGGPAGLTAALVAHGNRLSVLLLERAELLGGQVRRADARVRDVLGLEAPSGAALAERLAAHIVSAGVEHRTRSPVERISATKEGLRIELEGESIAADRVILATGLVPRRLGVPGEELLDPAAEARAEAPELAGRPVVVIGGGDEGADTARCLAEAGAEVTLIVRDRLRARPLFAEPLARTRVAIESAAVLGFEGSNGLLSHVRLDSGARLDAVKAYVRIGAEPAVPSIDPQPKRHADGRLVADGKGRTSVVGLYAVGDLVKPPSERYIAVACADGTIAARAIEDELRPTT